MSSEEYEFIISAIEFIATYGQRFLPFYHFNWNTGIWKFKNNAFEEMMLREEDRKLCTSFFADGSTALQVKDNKSNIQNILHCKRTDDIHFATYKFYLDVAKEIGNMLPKCPSQFGTIPQGVDLNDVGFRI